MIGKMREITIIPYTNQSIFLKSSVLKFAVLIKTNEIIPIIQAITCLVIVSGAIFQRRKTSKPKKIDRIIKIKVSSLVRNLKFITVLRIP